MSGVGGSGKITSSSGFGVTGRIGPWLRTSLIVLSLATAALVYLETGGPTRTGLVLVFMTIVPGAAIMGFTRTTGQLTIAAMSVAFSLAVCAAIATVSVWARSYHPRPMFVVTALVCAVLLLIAPLFGRPPSGSRFREPNSPAGVRADVTPKIRQRRRETPWSDSSGSAVPSRFPRSSK